LGCPEAELSVSIVDDSEIRGINRDYLQRDKSTNVISFSQHEGDEVPLGEVDLLGDVIISADTAARDACEAGQGYLDELYFLLIHGILHLCGFDHERGTEEQAQHMEEKERELFELAQKEFLQGGE